MNVFFHEYDIHLMYTLCEHLIFISTHMRMVALSLFRFVAFVKHFDGVAAYSGFVFFNEVLVPKLNNLTHRFFQYACPELVKALISVTINNAVPGHMLNPAAIQFDWSVCYRANFVRHRLTLSQQDVFRLI